ncbi:MAG: hypothetical protein B6D56_03715 [Candidatus Omnitrophica bacterium 4484_70.1]|nr:MAG: hypothetical protein B6D56_03715 [Candidatus Omnitrophica bacterium 4484_70.1]
MREKQLKLFDYQEEKKRDIKEKYKITLTLDKLIIISIVIFLLIVVSYSVGVVQGKKETLIGRTNVSEEEIKVVKPQIISQAEEKNSSPGDRSNEGKKVYTIQVATYLQKSIAYREKKKLEKQGFPVSISSKGRYLVIFVGNYSNEKEAQKVMSVLKKKYKDCFVRRL